MKKQKQFKLKRLLIRIVSVISIISILISSVVLSVSADTFDSVSFDYKSDSLQPNQLIYGKDYYIDDNGEGHNGSVIYRGFQMSDDDMLWGDSTLKYLNNRHVIIQLTFSRNLTFVAGQKYNISFPIRFVGEMLPDFDKNIWGKITLNKLSLIRYSSDVYYYDVWQDVDYNVLGSGYVYLNYTFTMRHDFVANGIGFGFNYVDTQSYALRVSGFNISGSLDIKTHPTYIMPDFTEQDNANNQEDNLLKNGGSLFNSLDTFYSQIGALGSDFSDLLKSSKAISVLFDSFIGSGTQLSLLLNFSLVLGLSVFILGVIQTVGSWTFSTVGKYTKGGKK